MLVTKNVLNRCNHSLLVGSLFLSPFSLLKEPLMTKRFNIFDKRRHTIKVSVFVYHMVENYQ